MNCSSSMFREMRTTSSWIASSGLPKPTDECWNRQVWSGDSVFFFTSHRSRCHCADLEAGVIEMFTESNLRYALLRRLETVQLKIFETGDRAVMVVSVSLVSFTPSCDFLPP